MRDCSRVVVVQLARMGDMLQTTPLLQAVAARHGFKPVVVAHGAGAEVARASGLASEVVEVDPGNLERELPALEALRPQLVYQLNLSPVARVLGRIWPQARWVGWRSVGGAMVNEPWAVGVVEMAGHRRLSRIHLVDILASYALEGGRGPQKLRFRPSAEDEEWAERELPPQGLVALQLGAASALRRWPVEWFAAVAEELVARGWRVVVVGTSQEAVLGQRLEVLMGRMARGVINLMGRTSVGRLGAVLGRCALLISGDTGSLHLATAVGTRVLGLFMGPAQVFETGPYGRGHIIFQAVAPCGPCLEQRPRCGGAAPCRRLIEPSMVAGPALAMAEGAGVEQIASRAVAGPMVQVYEALGGGFGQLYRPLRPGRLVPAEALALGLMEGLRVLMREGYEPGEGLEMLGWWAGAAGADAALMERWARMALEAGQGRVDGNAPRVLGVLARAARAGVVRAREAARAVAEVLEAAGGGQPERVLRATAVAGGI